MAQSCGGFVASLVDTEENPWLRQSCAEQKRGLAAGSFPCPCLLPAYFPGIAQQAKIRGSVQTRKQLSGA